MTTALMNLGTIRSRVISILGPSCPVTLDSRVLNRFNNLGERDVAAKSLCIETIGTAITSENSRIVAADYVKVLAVEYVPASGTGNPIGLGKIKPVQLGHNELKRGNVPQYWFPWGKYIIIEPLPVGAYNLNIYAATLPTSAMSADGNTPQVPSKLVNQIVQHAVIRGLIKDGRFGSAAKVYSSYVHRLMTVRRAVLAKYTETVQDMAIPDKVVARGETNQ
jgi:hypothetical protein